MSSAQVFQIAFHLGGVVDSSLRNAFNSARQNLSNMGSQSQIASGSMKVLGVAAAATAASIGALTVGLGAAVKATDEFNSSMKQIQSSTGMSTAQMKQMKEMSKNLYNKNLGEDWNDLAEAISTTKSVTGLAGKDLEKATANAIVYRDVFGEEVSQSIKATDTMMKNFGITSEQAYNLMAQGAQNGLNKSDELIDSANEYTPYFKSLGFSANQMFDTFSAGLKSGAFNLDKVGDAVKEFNIRSKDGSEASAAAYQALGMDAAKMSQIFARGGPEAQKSFRTVVQAISAVKDPVKKNEIGVALLGTQFEDLEKDVVAAMGTAKSQFDMTKQTMEQIQNIKYDTFGMALQGIARQVETGILIPIGEKLLPILTSFSKTFATVMPVIQKKASETFGSIGNVFSSVANKLGPAFSKIPGIFQNILTIAKPIIGQFVSFIKGIGSQIKDFWNSDGAQIMQAVRNVFTGISAVIKVLAPVILFIINMVWNNVKGVIQGALNVIIGVIKVFSGLFTGDFKKMWEGIKQIFFGAIQFVWNYINLLFVGRILGGIKAFATNALAPIRNMWTAIKGFFTGGVNNAWTQVVAMGTKVKQGFTIAKNEAISLASRMWAGVKQHFNDIVTGARKLPEKIGDGIKAMAGKALSGITTLGNKLLKGIGKMVNGVIDGLNWVMKKLSVNMTITPWTVPQYAQGTKGHPGGPAILGDGRGSNSGPELYRTPQGHVGLSPGRDTLMNLPKGTQVINARDTSKLMSQYNIPAYNMGNVVDGIKTGASWVSEKFSDIKDWTTDKVSDIKDTALDVFSYIGDPSKLFNKLLDKYGVTLPDISGPVGKIASGVLSKIKEVGLNFLTEKMSAFSFGGFGGGMEKDPFAVGRGSGYGGMMKYVEYWYNMVKDRFGPTRFMGGFANRANTADSSQKSMHAYGRAFDIGGSHQTMSKIAEFLRTNAKDIQHVIYNRRVSSNGRAWKKYTGPNPHTDHVHADFEGVRMAAEAAHGGAIPNVKGGAAAWQPMILQAAARMRESVTPAQVQGIIAQIYRESKGNQRIFQDPAVNDINMRNGNPARGLLQYIPSTFKNYMVKGHTDILNGFHQLLAFFNNTNWRKDLPYGKSGWGPTGARKYYKGGRTGYSQWALVGERGPELLKLPGGTDIFNNRESTGMLSSLINYAKGGKTGSIERTSTVKKDTQYQFVYSPQYQFDSGTDQEMVKQATALSYEDFKQMATQWLNEQQRLSFADE